MATKGKVLLLGGTGAMGIYLAPLLVDCGYAVDISTRKKKTDSIPGIRYLQGSAKDFEFVSRIANETHYDAVVDFMLYSYDEFESRYEQLLDLTDHYLFLSSYRVYGDSSTGITEETPRKIDFAKENLQFAGDTYGISKGRQENLLYQSDKANWTIIRPTMTYARNRFQFGSADNFDVVRSQRRLIAALPESIIDNPTCLTYGKDAAKMMARLVGNKAVFGEAYNLSTGETHTWREVSDIFGRVFGLSCMEVDTASYNDAYRQKGAMIDRELRREFDPQKVLDATGLSQRDFYSLEEGLRDAWDASSKNMFANATNAVEAHVRVDWLTNSRVDYSLIPESIRDQYRQLSTSIRGQEYPHIDEIDKKPVQQSHTEAKDQADQKPHKSSKAPEKALDKTQSSLFRKGLRSLRKDGVSATMKKYSKWRKKRKNVNVRLK